MSSGWEDRAAGWLAWARKPGHDGYWAYRDAFFALLPPPGRAALEVGCGEGRVCRDLRARGYSVTGLDASPTLVAEAAAADPEGEYVHAMAEALPFPDEAFDLVIAFNSLMDVVDMPAATAEAARILERGGDFCACVVHPLRDAGGWENADDSARFVIEGSYLTEGAYEIPVERDGLTFTFSSKRYPLESYARALEAANLLIEALREPAPPSGASHELRNSRIPNFSSGEQ